MTKELALDLIKLLSAIESWSFTKERGLLPEYLHDQLQWIVKKLSDEVLK